MNNDFFIKKLAFQKNKWNIMTTIKLFYIYEASY